MRPTRIDDPGRGAHGSGRALAGTVVAASPADPAQPTEAGLHCRVFELFEHTADLGLRVRAADLPSVYVEAAQALFSLLVEDLTTIRPTTEQRLTIPGTDPALVLFDWLSELLYAFNARQMLFGQFEADPGRDGLRGVARGERVDPARHRLEHEIKAITYHGLELRQVDGQWEAQVIVDV